MLEACYICYPIENPYIHSIIRLMEKVRFSNIKKFLRVTQPGEVEFSG